MCLLLPASTQETLQPGSSVCEPGSLLRPLPLESGLIFAFDHACCEAVMVASPSKGRYLNIFVLWITARLLKWFQRAVILYVVGRTFTSESANKDCSLALPPISLISWTSHLSSCDSIFSSPPAVYKFHISKLTSLTSCGGGLWESPGGSSWGKL